MSRRRRPLSPRERENSLVSQLQSGTVGGRIQSSPRRDHPPKKLAQKHRGKGFVEHGSDPNYPRPDDGFPSYEWLGDVKPNNWTAVDTWVDTTPVTV